LTVFFYLIIINNDCKHEHSKTEILLTTFMVGRFPWMVRVFLVR